MTLNQTLPVQGQGLRPAFSAEIDHSFRYVCDDRHLDPWVPGNAPVTPVFSRPKQNGCLVGGGQGRVPGAASHASRTVVIGKQAQKVRCGRCCCAAPAGCLETVQPGPAGTRRSRS